MIEIPNRRSKTVSLSSLPLSYCSNVLPGRSVPEIEEGIDSVTLPIRERFGHPMAVGLWFPRSVVDELTGSPHRITLFAEMLGSRSLPCYTLNAFPYGDFHGKRVKEQVYLPDWSQPGRMFYTARCAEILAAFLPDGGEGSISTVPLGFKGANKDPDFEHSCICELLATAVGLDRLSRETGKLIRLAIEPEPLCVLETTAEALAFFERLWWAAERAKVGAIARTHLGLC